MKSAKISTFYLPEEIQTVKIDFIKTRGIQTRLSLSKIQDVGENITFYYFFFWGGGGGGD